jgi:hypothetical protein
LAHRCIRSLQIGSPANTLVVPKRQGASMADWYLWDGQSRLGPMDRSELDDRIRHHPDPRSLMVWRNGLPDWTTVEAAFDVALTLPPPLPAADQPDAVAAQSGSRNFIARHWRGEYPLWASWWVVGTLSNLAGLAVVLGIAAIAGQRSYNPWSILTFLTLVWLFAISLWVWQAGGVWRSARRRIEQRRKLGKRAPWAWLARAAICLSLLQLIGFFVRAGAPQIAEAIAIAFKDDPSIPAYAIRVMNRGLEAEIAGGIKYGLTRDFDRVLGASPGVRVVHLNSTGGRLGEGEKLNALIRDKGLDTYVEEKCLSACTLAFVGGKQRILRKGAVLGFHRGAFAGRDEVDDGGGIQRGVFRAAGISSGFIDTALATKNKDIWRPTEPELLSAGVVTRITTGDEFAFGGGLTRQDWDQGLLKSAGVYRALKDKYPRSYEEILDIFLSGTEAGTQRVEVIAQARARLNESIKRLLPLADDAVLIEWGELARDEYRALQARDSAACYRYASGASFDKDIGALIPADLGQREAAIGERIVLSAKAREGGGNTDASWRKVRVNLSAKGYNQSDFELLSSNSAASSAYARLCSLSVDMMDEITRQPREDAAAILRQMYAPG